MEKKSGCVGQAGFCFSKAENRFIRGWLFLAWMSAAQAFQSSKEQSGILGEEVTGEQRQRYICHSRIEKIGVEGHPRLGTRVEISREGCGEIEEGGVGGPNPD